MKKTLLFLTSFLFCATIIGQNSADLRLNPEKNKTYRLSSVTEQTIVQTVNGNQQTIESETNYTISIKMVDATASFLVTEVRIDTISIATNSMGKNSKMSSASEGDIKSEESSDIMSYILNRLTKNPLYAKIDFSGKVTEIVNSGMIAGIILKDTSAITLTGTTAAAVKSQIVNMVSDNSLKVMIEMFTYNLPGKTVGKGEKWNQSTSTNSGGMTLEINTVYRLDDIKGDNAIASAESDIRPPANATPMESGGARITYDSLRGLSKSNISIDIKTGLVSESSSETRISGNLGVSVPGMTLDIPMDIDSSTRTFSVK
jgi:hypothetical protein